MKNTITVNNYNAYQPHMLLDFTFSYEKDVAHDDVCRTVIEIAEEVIVENMLISLIETLMGMMES